MSATPKKIYTGQPGTTAATVYTVPASTTTIIKNIVMCNTSASPATVTIYFVPSGSTASVANAIVNSYSITVSNTVTIDLSSVLNAGDFISTLQGTFGSVTVHISGVEMV